MFVITLESLWSGFAANVLFFMAGIQNISEDVMEAASIDGANKFQSFFKITLPMLAPVIRVILMLAVVGGMKNNE
ncbi:MAG: ABC transporter permease subunit [Clostridiales bacterium]|nr:MAG: ABC transporter permease subunit [Clostridiales bacterium]